MQEHGVPAKDGSKARGRTVAKARVTKAGSAVTRRRAGRKGSSRTFDPEAFLTTVGAGRSITAYQAKSYIFRQGTGCDAVFYIQTGHVELSVVSKQGKERVVGVLGPGAFLGEGCLAGQPRYLASARASTEAIVARVETGTLAKALKDHPEMSERFMAFLLLRNGQVEADLVDQLF